MSNDLEEFPLLLKLDFTFLRSTLRIVVYALLTWLSNPLWPSAYLFYAHTSYYILAWFTD